jgi:CheY-like chemotaxis protein
MNPKEIIEEQPLRPKILVIDDDPDISRALKVRLGACGLHVVRAFSGMDGFWTALQERPDVIISDFYMPDAQGNYVLGRLRSHPLTQHIPFMILTGRTVDGRSDCGMERELRGLGAEAYFTKPPDFEQILAELARFVPIARSPQATCP